MSKLGAYADFPLPEEWAEVLEGIRPASPPSPGRALPSLGHLVDACLDLIDDERNRQLIWGRFGPGLTLQAAGDEFGITRERVRQVVNKVSRTFVRNPQLKLVLDSVFMGLGRDGCVLVDVSGACSGHRPDATPEHLWTFVVNLWEEVQKRKMTSLPVGPDVFLFVPEALPDERRIVRLLAERASFMEEAQLARWLDVPPGALATMACGWPRVVRVCSGLYGLSTWTLPQVMKAVAEQLAEAGFAEWHFSEIGKATAAFDARLSQTPPRNFAAALSRPDVRELRYFEHAGRDGCWRLGALGDGHANNLEAIRAVLAAAQMPLHWREIQRRLSRQVYDGTVMALLSRETEFISLGRGVFALEGCRDDVSHQPIEAFMQELFVQGGQDWLPADVVLTLAQQRGLDAAEVLSLGRFSLQFRYWKWGTAEALFVTVEEANRRLFRRWFAQRDRRAMPPQAVLLAGLRQAFIAQEREVLKETVLLAQEHGAALPQEAADWAQWAMN
ncbi:sigma factor-like helix-turn-helix DNA-binding protein [Deinococcus aquaedulcis]|uniref:sigma factor-like helix-turn-helix DNA-binding protein n=1 Tax=Deinococcus aquaedulcis TaxID=2840455 RepID=UPI001C837DFC|nr:sigma factor-like helix-turn-helix DNA-binding protein [Deinococcus aquaedulcis]